MGKKFIAFAPWFFFFFPNKKLKKPNKFETKKLFFSPVFFSQVPPLKKALLLCVMVFSTHMLIGKVGKIGL